MRLSLIGAKMCFGSDASLVSDGPEALRSQGLGALLTHRLSLRHPPSWLMIEPLEEPGLPREAQAAHFFRQLEAACRRELSRGNLPIVIGGDQSCSIASLAAASKRAAGQDRSFGALWIDARLDAHTPDSSPTGDLRGMALARLLGYGAADPLEPPALEGSRVCALGARSHEEGEEELLLEAGAKIVWAPLDREESLARLFQEALRFLGRNDELAVSVDLSAIDPMDLPAVDLPEPGGLPLLEFLSAARASARRMREPFCLIEISEYNPSLDPTGSGAETVCEIIAALLGH